MNRLLLALRLLAATVPAAAAATYAGDGGPAHPAAPRPPARRVPTAARRPVRPLVVTTPAPMRVDPSAHFPPPTLFLKEPPVRAGALPRSVHVLRVPVPRSLPSGVPVRWVMTPGSRAEVLSATAGAIAPDAPDSSRAITVVTRIPARAAAGVLEVGDAAFTADTIQAVVPVELEIARVRAATIVPGRPAFAALAGHPLTLSVEVRNLGNSLDTVTVTAEMPAGWSRVAAQTVPLIPGERRLVAVVTKIPGYSGSTAAYPAFRALLSDSVAANTTVPVQVEDPTAERRSAVGPRLTVGTSTAFGDSVVSAPVLDFALNGAISNAVSVSGRAAYVPDEATVDRRALYRAGTYLGGTFLNVRAPTWYGSLGNTGSALSTLTGMGAFGVGVSGGISHGAVSGLGLFTAVPNGTGVQGGARGDYQTKRSSIGLAVSHFEDQGPSQRALDAVGLIAGSNLKGGLRLSGEAAWRSFHGGQGAGVALGVDRITSRDLFSISGGHAPGGSEAFGRALNDLSAAASHRFGERFSLQSSYFTSYDRPHSSGTKFTADGWSVGPRFLLRDGLTAEVDVRQSGFDSKGGTAEPFASNDRTQTLTLRKVGGRMQWLLGGNMGSTSRTNEIAGVSSTITATRYGFAGGGSFLLPRVVLTAGLDYSRSGSGAGFAPKQGRLLLGASRIAPFNSPMAPVFRMQSEITTWFGTQPMAVVTRIGAESQLPGGFGLVVDAERNPMLQATPGRTPWIVAVRLERGMVLGWASHIPTTRGSIFQDRNGNGIRDAGEDGLSGIMVRRGGESAVTDAWGRFSLPGHEQLPIEIDPVTLPKGTVAPSVATGNGGKNVSLGLVPTGELTVHLVRGTDELGRSPESPFDQLAVIAKDAAGLEWYLRADTTGMVHYDGLPPGHYTVTADFSGSTERLRQIGDPVVLELVPGVNPPVEIKFAPRAARLFNGGSAQTTPGRR